VSQPADHSSRLYAAGGLKPAFASHQRGDSLGTPMFVYRWQDAKRALERLRDYEGSPHDGVIMEGRGAYTVVDGERLALGPRDLVLTPNGTWHDHGIEAGGTQCVWQDGLDIPLMNALDANFFEVHPDVVQKPSTLSRENWSKPYSPVFLYKWDESYAAVMREGRYEYANPLTGGPIMPTMGARLDRIEGETKPLRHTGSMIYQVAAGRGWSEIGGKRFEWEEKDIFCVPSWTLYRHGSPGTAVLFSFNDLPAMRSLALYREAAS
jgi:gentisate 1,2-dioxygenase